MLMCVIYVLNRVRKAATIDEIVQSALLACRGLVVGLTMFLDKRIMIWYIIAFVGEFLDAMTCG